MARSRPGAVMGVPSISNPPEERVSSPPMMRSSVDLPQPEAPTSATNSPVCSVRLMSRRASKESKRLARWVTCNVLISKPSFLRPWEKFAMEEAQRLVRDQADQPDGDDAHKDAVGLQKALSLQDGVAQAGIGCHQFGDH